jgi:hypothetical protein
LKAQESGEELDIDDLVAALPEESSPLLELDSDDLDL